MTHSRPYRDANDLQRLQDYSALRLARDPRGWLHSGDLPHRLFNGGREYAPAELLRLWENESGDIGGWALLNPPDSFDIQSHDAAVISEALGWAKSQLSAPQIESDLWEGDDFRAALFAQHGFALDGEAPPYAVTLRALDDLPPVPVLPEGFSIRAARGVHDAAALAAVHAGSFDSAWTAEAYARVMESPGYAPEREFVVVAPDGRFAAFTETWHDPHNRLGYFEPVGTHKDFWRRGLAKALMIHAMHEMRASGMTHARVMHESEEENPAPAALYASLGFRLQFRTMLWAKVRNQEVG